MTEYQISLTIAAILAGMVLVAVASYLRPVHGACASVFSVFVGMPHLRYINDYMLTYLFIFNLVVPAAAFGVCARFAVERKPLPRPGPFAPFLLAILIYETVALTWAPDFFFGLGGVFNVWCNTAFFFLTVLTVTDEKGLRALLTAFLASAFVNSLFMVYTAFYHNEFTITLARHTEIYFQLFSQEVWGRLGGLCSANQAGGLLIFAAFCAFAWGLGVKTRTKRYLFYALAAFFFALMPQTASRGTLIGGVAGPLVFFFLHPKTRARYLNYAGWFLVFSAVCVLVSRPDFLDKFLIGFGFKGIFNPASATDLTGAQEHVGFAIRIKYWLAAMDEMAEHPVKLLFGLGSGGFTYYSTEVQANSFFLAFFFDMGLFGAALLAYLLFRILRFMAVPLSVADAFTGRMYLACALGLFAEIGVHGLIEYDITSHIGRFVYMFIAITAAALNVVKRELEERGGEKTGGKTFF